MEIPSSQVASEIQNTPVRKPFTSLLLGPRPWVAIRIATIPSRPTSLLGTAGRRPHVPSILYWLLHVGLLWGWRPVSTGGSSCGVGGLCPPVVSAEVDLDDDVHIGCCGM